MHTDGVKCNELVNSKALKNIPKLTTFFKKRKDNTNLLSQKNALPKKRPKVITCPGFHYGNTSDRLPLYAKYKKDDEMSKTVNSLNNNGQWSIYSIDCTGEKVIGRKSLRKDSQACGA